MLENMFLACFSGISIKKYFSVSIQSVIVDIFEVEGNSRTLNSKKEAIAVESRNSSNFLISFPQASTII